MGEIEQERLRICIIAINLFPALLSAIRGFVRYSFSFSSLSRTPHFYGKGERKKGNEPWRKTKNRFSRKKKGEKNNSSFPAPSRGLRTLRSNNRSGTDCEVIHVACTKKQANIPSPPALRSPPLSLRNENWSLAIYGKSALEQKCDPHFATHLGTKERATTWVLQDAAPPPSHMSHRKLGCLVCVFRRSHHDWI